MEILKFLLILITFYFEFSSEFNENPSERILRYEPEEISNENLQRLTSLSNIQHFNETLKEILIPRVVGTPGHDKVRDYIRDSLDKLNWDVKIDSFFDAVPPHNKRLKFENIIATLNPNAERFLVLSCHYDSKLIPNIEFLGATDSAVPCAMLLNLAETLKSPLRTLKQSNDKFGLILLFFDGEEAFVEWGPKDSIYGARHLSRKWRNEGFLKHIDMLLLLDLIGGPDPKFYSFFPNTEKWFVKFLQIEERLALNGFLDNYTTSSASKKLPNRYFIPQSANSYIEDDHTPFVRLNVPVLHLITVPFPKFWHTEGDNADVIDYRTVENLNKILRVFVAEYLEMKL